MYRAHIWQDIHELAAYLQIYRKDYLTHYKTEPKIVATSGGMDGLHFGHARCIQESTELGECLIVIVNGDGFLLRKKGYVFMPHNERMEIISCLAGVSHVVGWDDGTQFIDGALEILRPDVFAKGGDRSDPGSLASVELAVCEKIGCTIAYGVGGREKLQSSSSLCKQLKSNY
jgi:cytidyltransferase-like protein